MPRPVEIDLPSERELRMHRSFAAPPDLVFDAHTVPALLENWYGEAGWALIICDIDLRPGGAFRYVTRQPEGKEVGQFGVFREVERPTLLVHTENWEDWNPGEVLVTSRFAPEGEGTLLTVTTLFPSKDVRDQLVGFGMTDGAETAFARLDALLAERA